MFASIKLYGKQTFNLDLFTCTAVETETVPLDKQKEATLLNFEVVGSRTMAIIIPAGSGDEKL